MNEFLSFAPISRTYQEDDRVYDLFFCIIFGARTTVDVSFEVLKDLYRIQEVLLGWHTTTSPSASVERLFRGTADVFTGKCAAIGDTNFVKPPLLELYYRMKVTVW